MLGLEVLAMWTSALWVGEGGALSWTTAEPRCRARQVAIRKSILRPGAPQGDQVEDRPTGRRRHSFSGSGTSVIPSRTWGDPRMSESSTDASLTFQNCRTSPDRRIGILRRETSRPRTPGRLPNLRRGMRPRSVWRPAHHRDVVTGEWGQLVGIVARMTGPSASHGGICDVCGPSRSRAALPLARQAPEVRACLTGEAAALKSGRR